jgi:hypothetical protein
VHTIEALVVVAVTIQNEYPIILFWCRGLRGQELPVNHTLIHGFRFTDPRSVFEQYAIVSQSDIADAIGRLEVREGHSLGRSEAKKEQPASNSTN